MAGLKGNHLVCKDGLFGHRGILEGNPAPGSQHLPCILLGPGCFRFDLHNISFHQKVGEKNISRTNCLVFLKPFTKIKHFLTIEIVVESYSLFHNDVVAGTLSNRITYTSLLLQYHVLKRAG